MKIDTARLTIRSFELTDLEELFNLVNDKIVEKFVPNAYCSNIEQAQDNLDVYANGDLIHDFYLAICKDEVIIGAIIAVEVYKGYLDVSYIIGEQCRHKHYALEAMEAFLNWLKENTKFLGVDLEIDKSNEPSKKLSLRLHADPMEVIGNKKYYRIRL